MSCMPGCAVWLASLRQLPAQDDAERQWGGKMSASRSMHFCRCMAELLVAVFGEASQHPILFLGAVECTFVRKIVR